MSNGPHHPCRAESVQHLFTTAVVTSTRTALTGEGGDSDTHGLDTGRVYSRPLADTVSVLALVGAGFTCFALVRALLCRHAGRGRCGAPAGHST